MISVSDTIDIFFIRHFQMRPRQRMIEMKMDLCQDPYIVECLNSALEIQDERQGKTHSRTNRRTKELH